MSGFCCGARAAELLAGIDSAFEADRYARERARAARSDAVAARDALVESVRRAHGEGVPYFIIARHHAHARNLDCDVPCQTRLAARLRKQVSRRRRSAAVRDDRVT